ncbi:hypothetical protein BaRGS_00031576, partial [Batillaria attramentaria]
MKTCLPRPKPQQCGTCVGANMPRLMKLLHLRSSPIWTTFSLRLSSQLAGIPCKRGLE